MSLRSRISMTVRGTVLGLAVLSCDGAPTTPSGTGPDSPVPTPPPPPVEPLLPRAEADRVVMEVAGPTSIRVTGEHLDWVTSASLRGAGGGIPPSQVLSGLPIPSGDTLMDVRFTIPVSLHNGRYDLHLSFRSPSERVSGTILAEILEVRRPMAHIDSVTLTHPTGLREWAQLRLWGTRLGTVDSVAVVVPGGAPGHQVRAADQPPIPSDTLVDQFLWVDPLVPAGRYAVLVNLPGSVEVAAMTLTMPSAVDIGPQLPPVLEGLHLSAQRRPGISGFSLRGTGFDQLATFVLAPATGNPGSSVDPTIQTNSCCWETLYPATTSTWLDLAVPPEVGLGSYDLTVVQGALSSVIPGAITVTPLDTVDLPSTGSLTISGSLDTNHAQCWYIVDWFWEYPQPCEFVRVRMPGPGTLTASLAFAAPPCADPSHLHISLLIDAVADDRNYENDSWWAWCEPYSTEEEPTRITGAGVLELAVGLEELPFGWPEDATLPYTVTLTFVPDTP